MGPKPSRKPKPKPEKPKLSAKQRRDLEYELLERLCHKIPQKLVRKLMGGKDCGRLNKQAATYDLAWGGDTTDLGEFLRSVSALLVRISGHYTRWMRGQSGEADPMLVGQNTPALEEYRKVQVKLAELKLARESGQSIPRHDVHEGLQAFSRVLRGAGERLQQRYGPDAQQILDEALTEAVEAVERKIGNGPGSSDNPGS